MLKWYITPQMIMILIYPQMIMRMILNITQGVHRGLGVGYIWCNAPSKFLQKITTFDLKHSFPIN
jgi:hypothetical protein